MQARWTFCGIDTAWHWNLISLFHLAILGVVLVYISVLLLTMCTYGVEADQPVNGIQPIPGEIIYTQIDQVTLMTIGPSVPYTGFISHDIDGDGRNELIFGTQDGRLIVYDTLQRREEMNRSLTTEKVFSISVGNVDGDPSMELVVATGEAEVLIIDYQSGSIQRRDTSHPTIEPIALYDPDLDGISDLVYISDYRLVRLSGDGTERYNKSLWAQTESIGPRLDMLIGDVDGDSRDEVFVSDSGTGTFRSRHYWRYDAATGILESYKSVDEAIFESAPLLISLDGTPHIVIGCYQRTDTGSNSYDLVLIDPSSDNVELLNIYESDEYLGWRYLSYFDAGGSPAVIMCSRYMDMIAWDLGAGAITWEVDGESTNRIPQAPIACDIDNDGEYEVVVPVDGLVILDSRNGNQETVIQVSEHTKEELNLLVDDIDADGYSEICYGYQDVYGGGDYHVSLFDTPDIWIKMDPEVSPIPLDMYAGIENEMGFIVENVTANNVPYLIRLGLSNNPWGTFLTADLDVPNRAILVLQGEHMILKDLTIDVVEFTVRVGFVCIPSWNFSYEGDNSISIDPMFKTRKVQNRSFRNAFRVERDLAFLVDRLELVDDDGTTLRNGSWVRPGTNLSINDIWIVYEGSALVLPPEDTFAITATSSEMNWTANLTSGPPFFIKIYSPASSGPFDIVMRIFQLPLDDLSDSMVTYSISVDTNPPVVVSSHPEDGYWVTEERIDVVVSAEDLDSGLEVNTTRYQVIHGTGDVDELNWTRVHSDDIISENGKGVFEIEVFLDAGRNTVVWEFSDAVGNVLRFDQVVNRDDTSISFSDFSPTGWVNATDVVVSVKVTDLYGSGVDGRSIQYSFSHDDLLAFSEWSDTDGYPDAQEIHVKLNYTGIEGTTNYIRFRGHDVARSEHIVSEVYTIWIDTTPPVVQLVFPSLDVANDPYRKEIELRVTERGSGIGEAWIELVDKVEGQPVDDQHEVSGTGEGEYRVLIDFNESSGHTYSFYFEINDSSGLVGKYGPVDIRFNGPPIISSILPVNGSEFRKGERIDITLTVEDPDDDNLTIQWFLDGAPYESTSTSFSYRDFDEGVHTIKVVVGDGYHSTEEQVEVYVTQVEVSNIQENTLVIVFVVVMIVILSVGHIWWRGKQRDLNRDRPS